MLAEWGYGRECTIDLSSFLSDALALGKEVASLAAFQAVIATILHKPHLMLTKTQKTVLFAGTFFFNRVADAALESISHGRHFTVHFLSAQPSIQRGLPCIACAACHVLTFKVPAVFL